MVRKLVAQYCRRRDDADGLVVGGGLRDENYSCVVIIVWGNGMNLWCLVLSVKKSWSEEVPH